MDERKLIYADDAIEAIEEIEWYHQNTNKEMVSGANSSEHQAWYKAEDVYEALEKLPSAQPHWTPCSEGMPKTNGEYLVTRASANLYCYIDIVKKTNVSGDIASDIVAWMPLPEPYKE